MVRKGRWFHCGHVQLRVRDCHGICFHNLRPFERAGWAGVAVIRVSGPAAPAALAAMVRKAARSRRKRRFASDHPDTAAPLDQALVLYFAKPDSETGEDVAEFQVHGGRAVVNAVLDALGSIPGTAVWLSPGQFCVARLCERQAGPRRGGQGLPILWTRRPKPSSFRPA